MSKTNFYLHFIKHDQEIL